MPRTKKRPAANIFALPCPICGAKANESCISRQTGKPIPTTHVSRVGPAASAAAYLQRVLTPSAPGKPFVWFRAHGTDERGKHCSFRIRAQSIEDAARLAPVRAFRGFTFTRAELDPEQ